MDRFICIHAHFYQPSRENPWLEEVEFQESAQPYHDWNQRITAECYAPNLAAPLSDSEGRITEIVCNYEKISFDFGPTLLAWMELCQPDFYKGIIEADKMGAERFSGHGSAIAQIYNHVIMPLTNERDKYTQVRWGIADFKNRFKRYPEGMWLSETAVDIETLEILAEHDIKFTILAPHQADAFRRIGDENWMKVDEGRIDTRRAYVCQLPSGRKLNIFFYDPDISHGVAFGALLHDGETFARRLVSASSEQANASELVNLATDGETYGHHHKFGDMALASCIRFLETRGLASLTNYGQFLEKFQPTYEVTIIENTSWSCVHGIDRWRSDCGCNLGRQGWNQKWRQPLREAMDWLTDRLAQIYQEESSKYLRDPWTTRDEYIQVILDRSKLRVERFLVRHSGKELSTNEKAIILKLLEMQRHSLLMHASCGWFFDDISGIEPIQIMRHAARAMQIAVEVSGIDLEREYKQILAKATSNVSEFQNGAKIFDEFVKTASVSLLKIGIHYAISSIFDGSSTKPSRIYSYRVENEFYETFQLGGIRLAIGKAKISSEITWEEQQVTFVVLREGDRNVRAGVNLLREDNLFFAMCEEFRSALQKANISEIITLITKHFGNNIYSLRDILKDGQAKMVSKKAQ